MGQATAIGPSSIEGSLFLVMNVPAVEVVAVCCGCTADAFSTDDDDALLLASTTLPPGQLGAYFGHSRTPPAGQLLTLYTSHYA